MLQTYLWRRRAWHSSLRSDAPSACMHPTPPVLHATTSPTMLTGRMFTFDSRRVRPVFPGQGRQLGATGLDVAHDLCVLPARYL